MDRARALDATLLATMVVGLLLASTVVRIGAWGFDAWAYWSVDLAHAYDAPVGDLGAFLYAPPLALAFAVLGMLPWQAFLVAWTALLAIVLAWLGRGRAAILFLVPVVALEVYYGNVHLLLAAAVVLGFRWPAAWAFVLLTKVTPGVGLAWFVARRDWRSLGVALGATAALAGASFAVAPGLWAGWVGMLLDQGGTTAPTAIGSLMGPLWLRVALGAVVAFVGGLAGRRWPVAVAVALAIPQVWMISPSVLVALVPLVAMDRREPLPAMVSRPTWSWRTARPAPRS